MDTLPTRAHAARRQAATTAIALATALTLGGCGQIMGEDLSLMTITVTNHTDHELTVEWVGNPVGDVAAGESGDAQLGTTPDHCLVEGVTASTDDSTLVATMPTPICDGDTWTIEQSDLVPAPVTSPSPTS